MPTGWVETIFLRNMALELRNNDIYQIITRPMLMYTGVIRPRDVNMGNGRLIGAEIKGY